MNCSESKDIYNVKNIYILNECCYFELSNKDKMHHDNDFFKNPQNFWTVILDMCH